MDKLLRLLDNDARLSNEKLAAMLDKTEIEIAELIDEYEKSGVIRGYKAVVDWERTDREYVTALIELRITPQRDSGFDSIAEQIMDFDEVESLYLMSGGYDLAVTVTGKTFKEVAMFVAKQLASVEGVLSTATHFVLRRYKDRNVRFLEEKTDERGVF